MVALADALERTRPFASPDTTRPHMTAPYGARVDGVWWMAATDGHRAALVRCDEAEGVKVPGSPPVDQVIPRDARMLGEIDAAALEPARCLPAGWICNITLSRTWPRLTCIKSRGSGKKAKSVRILSDVEIDWALRLDVPEKDGRGINVRYLLDAFDLCGTGTVNVWQLGSLDPFAFTPTADPILSNAALAVVMPVRL